MDNTDPSQPQPPSSGEGLFSERQAQGTPESANTTPPASYPTSVPNANSPYGAPQFLAVLTRLHRRDIRHPMVLRLIHTERMRHLLCPWGVSQMDIQRAHKEDIRIPQRCLLGCMRLRPFLGANLQQVDFRLLMYHRPAQCHLLALEDADQKGGNGYLLA